MKKQLKIDEKFKIFYGSEFVIEGVSGLTALRSNKVNFKLKLREQFSPKFKDGAYYSERRIELLESYFENITFDGCDIIEVTGFQKETVQSYSTFRGIYTHPNEGDNIIIIDCIGELIKKKL